MYHGYFNPATEEKLFEETLSGLERATKARDVAEEVSKLFEVSSIHSDLVVTKAFIEILIGIAANLRTGNSINNVREHINKVIARDKWKQREQKNRQVKPYKIDDKTVTLNITFTFDRDKFALIQEIIHQADMVLSQVVLSHFDGNPDITGTACRICDTPERLSVLLGRIRDEVGTEALKDIRYSSPSHGFERDHLTLLQTIQLTNYELQL